MATERRLGYVKMDCLGYSIPHVCQTIQSVNKQMSSSTPVHVAYTYVAGLSVVNGLCVECVFVCVVWCSCVYVCYVHVYSVVWTCA